MTQSAMAGRHAAWEALREAGPVVQVDGIYHLTRRADVLAVLRNADAFSSLAWGRGERPCMSPGAGFNVVALPAPANVDAPEHTRYREVLRRMLHPRALDELLPAMTAQAGVLVNAVAAGRCDVMSDVAVPFSAQAFLMYSGKL